MWGNELLLWRRSVLFWKIGWVQQQRLLSAQLFFGLIRNVSNWYLLCDLLPSATLHCTRGGGIILAVARDATVPSINVDSISLLGHDSPACKPAISTGFIIYDFGVSECGTEVTVRSASYVWLCFTEFSQVMCELVFCLPVLGRSRWSYRLSQQTELHFRHCNKWRCTNHEGHRFWVCILSIWFGLVFLRPFLKKRANKQKELSSPFCFFFEQNWFSVSIRWQKNFCCDF